MSAKIGTVLTQEIADPLFHLVRSILARIARTYLDVFPCAVFAHEHGGTFPALDYFLRSLFRE